MMTVKIFTGSEVRRYPGFSGKPWLKTLVLLLLLCSIPVSAGDQNEIQDRDPPGDLQNSAVSSPLPGYDSELPYQTLLPGAGDPGIIPVRQKNMSVAISRKISTDLLYLIDADVPEKGYTRVDVQRRMVREGKMKSGAQDTASATMTETTTQAGNLVLVYIDLMPSVPPSVVDPFVTSMVRHDDLEPSVVAWMDIDKVNELAVLDGIKNIRMAEPRVSQEAPVYHDTKYVNNRAGLPPLTSDDMKEQVREFENAPGIDLVNKEKMKTARGDVDELVAEDSRYFVNANTGDVELASYGYYSNLPVANQKYSRFISFDGNENGIPLSDDSAISIAQDFITQNYRNFYNRTMVLTRSQLIDHGDAGKTYYFVWREKINNVDSPNSVSVFVNANNGKILSYIGLDQPVDCNIIPSITRQDSLDTAAGQFSSVRISSTSARLAILPVDEKTRNLVWVVNVQGEPEDGFEQGGDAIIDAHSGEVLEVDYYA